jgi:Na+-driven multidrug efflux pump
MNYLWIASLCALIFMPAFVFDGILVGTTLNGVMRDGMVISLGVFLAAALVLQPLFGNVGLWASLHVWFIARGLIYWWGLERKKAGLFGG